jgi:hypothetical protein
MWDRKMASLIFLSNIFLSGGRNEGVTTDPAEFIRVAAKLNRSVVD